MEKILYGIKRPGLLCIGIHIFSLVILSLILNLKEGLAEENRAYVSGCLPVELFYVETSKDAKISGELIKVFAGAKQLSARLEGKEATLTIRSETRLPIATLSGKITPRIEKSENSESYKLSLIVEIGVPQVPAGIKHESRQMIVRDEIKLKKALKSWGVTIEGTLLDTLKNDKKLTESLDEQFGGLSILKLTRPRAKEVTVYFSSTDCDELMVEFIQAQQDYLELEASIPFVQQFEVFMRTMNEVRETVYGTAEDIEGVVGDMDKVLDESQSPVAAKLKEIMEETNGLSTELTEALGRIKNTMEKEHAELLKANDKFLKPVKDVRDGLEKSAKSIKKISKAIDGIKSYMDIMQITVVARDQKPSEQLRSLNKYIGGIKDKLGPLIENIPVLGIFLKLYSMAIENIADSAEKLEMIVNKRSQMANEAGISSPYVRLNSEHERMKTERRNAFKRVEDLKNLIAGKCNEVIPATEDYSAIHAIEDAATVAKEACKRKLINIKVHSAIFKEYDRAQYNVIKTRNGLYATGISNMDDYAKRREQYKISLWIQNTLERYSNPDLNMGKEILKQIEALWKKKGGNKTLEERKIWIAIESNVMPNKSDIKKLEWKNKDRLNELDAWIEKKKEYTLAKKNLDAAKLKMDGVNRSFREYYDCMRSQIRNIAEEEGWEKSMVEIIHFDLFSRK